MPMTAQASGPFDINTLPIDDENRYSNVGAFIVAVVDDDGNPVGRRAHCSGVLIHERVFLTAGHCTGPGEFPRPSFIALFVSLAADALDETTWIRGASYSWLGSSGIRVGQKEGSEVRMQRRSDLNALPRTPPPRVPPPLQAAPPHADPRWSRRHSFAFSSRRRFA
jgi:hypothetical protein